MVDKTRRKIADFWTLQRIIVAAVVVIVVIWIAMTIQVLNDNYKYQRQVDNAKLDNQVLELENENLKLEQMYYRTDEYKELSARALLGKAQPGEHMVILPRVQPTKSAKQTDEVSATKSNVDQWLDFLFGQHN